MFEFVFQESWLTRYLISRDIREHGTTVISLQYIIASANSSREESNNLVGSLVSLSQAAARCLKPQSPNPANHVGCCYDQSQGPLRPVKMTARLHSLRHQEKKSAGSNHRQHHQHQQAVHQGPSPAPSPSPSLSPSPKHSDGRRVSKNRMFFKNKCEKFFDSKKLLHVMCN